MIGLWKEYAIPYLYVVSIGSLLFFGLPLLLWPIRWARILKWTIPDHTHLAIYFGRCLGGVITVMALFAIISTGDIFIMRFWFAFILLLFFMMILIHGYGAWKKIQPVSETIEIGYWCIMLLVTLLFYPV